MFGGPLCPPKCRQLKFIPNQLLACIQGSGQVVALKVKTMNSRKRVLHSPKDRATTVLLVVYRLRRNISLHCLLGMAGQPVFIPLDVCPFCNLLWFGYVS